MKGLRVPPGEAGVGDEVGPKLLHRVHEDLEPVLLRLGRAQPGVVVEQLRGEEQGEVPLNKKENETKKQKWVFEGSLENEVLRNKREREREKEICV